MRGFAARPYIAWLTALSLALILLGAGPEDDAWISQQPRFVDLAHNRAGVDELLARLWKRFPDFPTRLRAVALLRLGTPYVLGCLGEEKPPDPDPLFRLDQSDCTVHVLTSTALAHAHSWDEAREWMKILNYHPDPDPVTYANRLHFTEDRLLSNPYFRILQPLPAQGHLRVTLNRGAQGAPLLKIPWEREVSLDYLRCSQVTLEALNPLPPEVVGVAFIRSSPGIAIVHEGLVVDRHWLIHADSRRGVTSRLDFLEYLRERAPHLDGVLFFEIL